MNGITKFFDRLVRGVFRLVLVAVAAIFLLSLLLATLVLMLAVTLWSVVTGRKPDPARIFGQFRKTSARYTRSAWRGGNRPGASSASPTADIVDIPAHDVRDVPQDASNRDQSPKRPGSEPMARMRH